MGDKREAPESPKTDIKDTQSPKADIPVKEDQLDSKDELVDEAEGEDR